MYNYEYILYIKILSNGNVNFVYKYLLHHHTFILYCATIPGYRALLLSLKNEKLNRLIYLFVSQGFWNLLFKVIKNWALLLCWIDHELVNWTYLHYRVTSPYKPNYSYGDDLWLPCSTTIITWHQQHLGKFSIYLVSRIFVWS